MTVPSTITYKEQSKKIINRFLITSIIINLTLTVIKYYLGQYVSNIALSADALHSALDVLSSVIVFTAIFFSYKKSDKFPFGLYKLENFASSLVSLLIILTAFEIGYSLLEKHTYLHATLYRQLITIVILLLIIAILLSYSKYEKKIGLKYGSSGIVSDAEHIKSDLFSIFIIVCSIVFSIYRLNIDKYIAIIILVIILRSGWELLKNATLALLDINIDKKTIESIKELISKFENLNEITSIKGRKSGRFMFLEIVVKFDIVSFEEAHKLSSLIEKTIYEKFPNVDNVIVHYEPLEKKQIKVCIPLQDKSVISIDFSNSKSFLVATYNLTTSNIISIKEIPNTFLDIKEKRGIQIALSLVKDENIDIVVINEHFINTGPYFVFKTFNKKFYFVEKLNVIDINKLVQDIANKLNTNKLYQGDVK